MFRSSPAKRNDSTGKGSGFANWIQSDPLGFGTLRSFDIQSWQNFPAISRARSVSRLVLTTGFSTASGPVGVS